MKCCIPKPPLPPFRMGKWLGRIPLVFLAVFLLRHPAKRLNKHVPLVTGVVYATSPAKVKPTAKMARMQVKQPFCTGSTSVIRSQTPQDRLYGPQIVRTTKYPSSQSESLRGPRFGGTPRGTGLFHKSVVRYR